MPPGTYINIAIADSIGCLDKMKKEYKMKKLIVIVLLLILLMMTATTAFAHTTGPCNGDKTGQEYAEHHIVEFAKAGNLGNDGHKPGSHKGFSVCL